MHTIKLFIVIFLLLLPSLSIGATYNIGPGQTYTSIADFTGWTSLAAGDTVRIHYATYKEMILLCQSGTAENPITIEGVPDASGNLPVLDGNDMVIPTQFDGHLSEYDLGGGQLAQGYGLVFVYRSLQDDDYSTFPEYITIKNLEIKSTTPESYTFTNSNEVVQSYPDASAGLYIKTGRHILVENCIIHDCGNGFDIQGVEQTVYDVTMRGCYIYGNGRTDARYDREHNSYTESVGMLIEYNYFGPLRSGAGGSSLKDRSVGTVIRYNIIYSGARTLDLCDSENVIGSGYDALNDPNYGDDWVYGNVFVNDENVSAGSPLAGNMFQFGYDNQADRTRSGTLKFFNNTIYVNIDSGTIYNLRVFDVSTSAETVELYNNVFHLNGTSLKWMANSSRGATTGTFNWRGGNRITTGYTDFYTGDSGTWTEHIAILEGVNTGVLADPANGDFTVPVDSPLINAGVALPSSITDTHPLDKQYKAVRTYESRADVDDIGAYLFGEAASTGNTQLGSGTTGDISDPTAPTVVLF